MYIYAQLNENKICIAVSSLAKEVISLDMIPIEALSENYIYRKYENGQWSAEKYIPEHAQIELGRMEALERSQSDQDEILMQLLLGGI